MDSKESLLLKIRQSEISREDIDVWEKLVPLMKPQEILDVYELVVHDPHAVTYLTNIVRKQQEAVHQGGAKEFLKVFRGQVASLSS